MDHADHVALIREAVVPGGTWLELGSGTGAFTLALAERLGPGGVIHSVDRDRGALAEQARALRARFPEVRLEQRVADFRTPLGLVGMDGVLMANALHFVKEKAPVLALVRSYLAPGGRFVLVEYDADRGNPWVPYPLGLATWERLAAANGFAGTRRIGRVPSRFLGAIYATVSVSAPEPAERSRR